LAALVRGMRRTLATAERNSGRYADGESPGRFNVYDREGKPCRRCRTAIERIVQAGRSTYFCPRCQPDDARS
jgi:formamidopyrimidine-DNA glycosylase